MLTPRRRVVVDVEATGLESYHQATEVAWYDLSTDAYGVFIPPHSLEHANEESLEIHGYDQRIKGQPVDDGTQIQALWELLHDGGRKATIVGANPSFDTEHLAGMFTRAGLPSQPFHHRKINVSEGAYWMFPGVFADTPGLKDVADLLGIPLPGHHAALDDVFATATIQRALESLRATVTVDQSLLTALAGAR